jgi:ribulose-phosphate 3-epimerase
VSRDSNKSMQIVPTILTDKLDDLLKMVRQAERFTNYIQIDVMDGHFVPSKSFSLEALGELKADLSCELHLMVKEPLHYVDSLNWECLKRIIFHFEATTEQERIISAIQRKGLEAGMAVNPDTTFKEFEPLMTKVDSILFLSVDPGHYGSPFRPEVLEKIKEVRRAYPDKTLGIDGGVSLDNLKDIMDSQVNYASVGSRIFLHENPSESYKIFLEKTREIS